MPRRRGHARLPSEDAGELVDLSDKRAGIVISSLDVNTQHKLLCRQLCNERQELRKTAVRLLTEGVLGEEDVPTLLNGAIELVPLLPSPLVLEAMREQLEMGSEEKSRDAPKEGAGEKNREEKPSFTTGEASSVPEAAGGPTGHSKTATGTPPEEEGKGDKVPAPPRQHLRRSSDERIQIREARRQHVLLNEKFFQTIPDMKIDKFELLLREARPISPLTRFGRNPAPELLVIQSEPALGEVIQPKRVHREAEASQKKGGREGVRNLSAPTGAPSSALVPGGGSGGGVVASGAGGGGYGPKARGPPSAGPLTPRRRRQQQLLAMAGNHRDAEEDSPEKSRFHGQNGRGPVGGPGQRKPPLRGKRLAAGNRDRGMEFGGKEIRCGGGDSGDGGGGGDPPPPAFGQQSVLNPKQTRWSQDHKLTPTTTPKKTTTGEGAPQAHRVPNVVGPNLNFVFPPPDEPSHEAENNKKRGGGEEEKEKVSRAAVVPLDPAAFANAAPALNKPSNLPSEVYEDDFNEEEEEKEEEEEAVVLVNSDMTLPPGFLASQKLAKEGLPKKRASGPPPPHRQRGKSGEPPAGDNDDDELPSLGDLANDIPEVFELAASVNDLVAAAAAEEKTVGATSGQGQDLDSVIQRAASVRGTTVSMGAGGVFASSPSFNFAASTSFCNLLASPAYSKSIAYASRLVGVSPGGGMEEFSEEDMDPSRNPFASIVRTPHSSSDPNSPFEVEEVLTEEQRRKKNENRRLPATPLPPPTVTEALHLPLPDEPLDIDSIFGGSQSFSSEYMYGEPQTYLPRPPLTGGNLLGDFHDFTEEEDFKVLDDGRQGMQKKSTSPQNVVHKDRYGHPVSTNTSRSQPMSSAPISTVRSRNSVGSSLEVPSSGHRHSGVEGGQSAHALHSPRQMLWKTRTDSRSDAPRSNKVEEEEERKKREERENRRGSRPTLTSEPKSSLSTTRESDAAVKRASQSFSGPLVSSSPKKGMSGERKSLSQSSPEVKSAPPALDKDPFKSGVISPRRLSSQPLSLSLSKRSSAQGTPRDTPGTTPDSYRTTPHSSSITPPTTTNNSTNHSNNSSSMLLGKPPMAVLHGDKRNSEMSDARSPALEKKVSTSGTGSFPYYSVTKRQLSHSGSTASVRNSQEDAAPTPHKPPIPRPQIRLSQIRRPFGSATLYSPLKTE